MVGPLIGVDPRSLRRRIADAVLAAPTVPSRLGDILLAPHQVDAAGRLLSLLRRRGGAFLADATGMGKTFVALATAPAVGRPLIVAPAALRAMWCDALARARLTGDVASYEALSHGGTGLARPPLLILDEAHHARNPTSKRYHALADLAWGTPVILISATPVHNRWRDLRVLLALFAGSEALKMRRTDVAALVVRRMAVPREHPPVPQEGDEPLPGPALGASSLPSLQEPRWLAIRPDPETLRAIEVLPPAVPPADGGSAHALLQLGLVRAWASSGAALRAVLTRRLQRSTALLSALESGRLPTRRELAAWGVVDGAVQLGFPELLAASVAGHDAGRLAAAAAEHQNGVRRVLGALERGGDQDAARVGHLRAVLDEQGETGIVGFTQFADTAVAMFRALVPQGAVALVTGRGARVASGVVPVEDVVRRFDLDPISPQRQADRLMPLRLLIATDVLSEGLSLRRAGVLVHLDLPWTIARLEQRIGRLRRIGSPHDRIAVFALGPPVGSRALQKVVRALQRKARTMADAVGATGHVQGPMLGPRLARTTRALTSGSEAEANERLRRLIGRWVDGAPVVSASGDVLARGRVPGQRLSAEWAALALVRRLGDPIVVAITPAGVSDRPSDVLPVARLATTVVAGPEGIGSNAEAPVLDRLGDWLEGQRAAGLVRPAIEAPSAAHAAILRYLDGVTANEGRAGRVALAPLVERCRELVLAARGAGAERALARWLVTRASAAGDAEAGLRELIHLLDSRRAGLRAAPGEIRVEALLIMEPGDERRNGTMHGAGEGAA